MAAALSSIGFEVFGDRKEGRAATGEETFSAGTTGKPPQPKIFITHLLDDA